MDNIRTTVFCTLQFEGIHCWANCPIDEVAYLRDLHRHVFHVRAVKQVFHDDRDIEFIQFKGTLSRYINSKYPKYHPTGNALMMGTTSCEMLARDLMEEFDLLECEVNEDGENGAVLTRV